MENAEDVDEEAAMQPEPQAPPARARSDQETASAGVPVVLPQAIMPRRSPAGASESRPEKPDAGEPDGSGAPTIHVSIGRVEVRAVQPPPKPRRRPERPAPMLSLDDYLKRYGRST